MDLKRIQYFIALADTLHFSKTADNLYISQSTLSYNIAELELELGVCLFIRNKRSVALTPAGNTLLPLAKQIVNSVNNFEQQAVLISKEEQALINLNICFDDSSQRFDLLGINEAIFKTKENNTNTHIQSFYANLDTIISSLRKGIYDIGFIVMSCDESIPEEFNYVEMKSTKLSIISSHNLDASNYHHALSSKPLYLLRGDKRWSKQIITILKSLEIEPTINWENNFSSMLSRVSLGDGITIFPRYEFEAENRSGRKLNAYDFPGENAMISYRAIWRIDNYNPGILQLINELKNYL